MTTKKLTPDNVLERVNSQLLPALLSVNEVLSDMINNGSGAILFTTGLSGMFPMPFVGNVGILMSGFRNCATNLGVLKIIKDCLNCNTKTSFIELDGCVM